jgi:hypothetical protein
MADLQHKSLPQGLKGPMILLDFMYGLKPVRENLAIAK